MTDLDVETSRAVVDAALAEALRIGVPMAVAVCDAGGHLLAFARMDDCMVLAAETVQAKARAAVYFRRPTAAGWPERWRPQAERGRRTSRWRPPESGGGSRRAEPPVDAEQPLLIIGGGTVGLAAAVTAGELGRRAVIIEKTASLGGMLHWSSGRFSAAGTRRQSERGIDDNADLHYRDVMAIGHERADPGLVRFAVDLAGPTVDWLDDLGFPFAAETPALVTGHELYTMPRMYWGGSDPMAGGETILETLLRHVDPSLVEVHASTAARRLVVADGRIEGVEVTAGTGTRVLSATDLILATGGYAAGRALVAQLQPRFAAALTGCMDHATGDGHRMLMNLGAEITHADTYLPTMGMIEDPDKPGHGIRLAAARVIVDSQQRAPWEMGEHRRRTIRSRGHAPSAGRMVRDPQLSEVDWCR